MDAPYTPDRPSKSVNIITHMLKFNHFCSWRIERASLKGKQFYFVVGLLICLVLGHFKKWRRRGLCLHEGRLQRLL